MPQLRGKNKSAKKRDWRTAFVHTKGRDHNSGNARKNGAFFKSQVVERPTDQPPCHQPVALAALALVVLAPPLPPHCCRLPQLLQRHRRRRVPPMQLHNRLVRFQCPPQRPDGA